MRAKSYLTLHHGLLAVALYQAHDESKERLKSGWAVPLEWLLRYSANPGETTLTTVSPGTGPGNEAALEGGIETSATPVCGFRQSLQA